MSTAKRKKDKKPRPKLRPISSPDHASTSSAHDEFGFSDVILTRARDEPKTGVETRTGQMNDVDNSIVGDLPKDGADLRKVAASQHSQLNRSPERMEAFLDKTWTGGVDQETKVATGPSFELTAKPSESDANYSVRRLTSGVEETRDVNIERKDVAMSSLKTSTTIPVTCEPVRYEEKVPISNVATMESESVGKSACSESKTDSDEANNAHRKRDDVTVPSFGVATTIPKSRDSVVNDEEGSVLIAATVQPESVGESTDSKSTYYVGESMSAHRTLQDEEMSSFKTEIKPVSCDAKRKDEASSCFEGEIAVKSSDSEACNTDATKEETAMPSSKADTAPSALLSSSPTSETGANYASQYFCEETPDTIKTHTTIETDSITQHEEDDADGSLESIQQPDFDYEKKSTPTKSEAARDVKDPETTTSTPVFSNVTTFSNVAALKTTDPNGKDGEDTTPHVKRTKRRSSKRLQPRSSLFSPGDREGPNPKTPDTDGYDIFGFDLIKSESERGSVKAQSDQEGVASIEGSCEILKPVNLETTYVVDHVEKVGLDASKIGETPTIDDKREEGLRKSSIEGNSSTSYSRGASSVSFGSLNASFESEKADIVHLLGSTSDPHREGSPIDSCSDSDSSFTSSDAETSYFSESRVSTEGRNHPQCATPLSKMRPTYPPNLPMRSHVHPKSSSFGTRSAIEMRLSLSVSEEDAEEARLSLQDAVENQENNEQEELILYQTYDPTRGDSFGSSLVESASSDSEYENAPLHQSEPNPEPGEDSDRYHASLTPFSNTSASTDDAGVVNELNTYLMSSNVDDGNVQIETPPSGRLSPVADGHIQSALERSSVKYIDTPTPTNADGARYIYADVQSAVVAANAKAGARKPTSSLDTPSMSSSGLQYNIKDAPKPTQVHSPGGAFNTTSSKSSPFTPKEKIQSLTGLHSLAYSEDDNIDHDEKTPPTFRHIRKEVDEETAELIPISVSKTEASPSRWGLLFCVSLLNFLAGWTCFSVAPIASTSETLGDVQPEYLVSTFLAANCIACVFEPAILGRLGLRKTIVFGALLLMLGSLIKSGGAPLLDFMGEGRGWRIYLGFFSAGFSHPFYQCTVSILSNAWFPERERRIASDLALNCYQLGIAFSFLFGTFLVNSEDDVNSYFQLFSLTSVGAFCLASFLVDDAPPNSPSGALESSKTKRQTRPKKEQQKLRRKKSSTPKTSTKSKIYDSNVNLPTPEHCESNVSVKEIICLDQDLGGLADVKHEERSLLLTQPLPRSPSPTMSGIISGRTYGSTENAQSAVSSNSSPHEFDGVEPVILQSPHNLDIDVRGDQVWILIKACFSFKGFSQSLLAYVASGIVINTLSTFISDLFQINRAPKLYVGIVGGGFQLLTMTSSLIYSKCANHSRNIYRSILILLVLDASALSMCSLQLVRSSSAGNLNLSIWVLVVALLVGPLPYLSSNLGSRVGRPLSDNGVLVVQRLFSNLTSAAFIPAFSILRNFSMSQSQESPAFTFSIYLLVLFTVLSAIYFAFFNSPSLLYEEEFYVCGSGACPSNPNTMLILPYRKFVQPPYQPWVPPGRRKRSDKYPFLIPS